MAVAGLDHIVIEVADWDRTIPFYRDVLGAQVIERNGGHAFRFGDWQINCHGPGSKTDPATHVPVSPETTHVCLVWDGDLASARAHLDAHGVAVVTGPHSRAGCRGPGESLYFRDPDGALLEFITYP